MKNFRQKGLNFEIRVARLLSSWINRCYNDNRLHFWRTSGSGSISSKIKNIATDFFTGDITPLTDVSKKYFINIIVECKNVEFDNNFFRSSFIPTLLQEYIDKLYEQMKINNKKHGFLFLKRNRGIIWLLIIDTDEIKYTDFDYIRIKDTKRDYYISLIDFNTLVQKVNFEIFFNNFI